MRCHSIRRCAAFSLAAFLLWLPPQLGVATVADARATLVTAPEDYPNKLKEYLAARETYDNEANAYWSSIADKRRLRTTKRRNNEEIFVNDYVPTQPPTYAGPPKPVHPPAPNEAGSLAT